MRRDEKAQRRSGSEGIFVGRKERTARPLERGKSGELRIYNSTTEQVQRAGVTFW